MLAIKGGKAVYSGQWPAWPVSNPEITARLIRTLESRRWTIRGIYNGHKSVQTEFCRKFADYNGVKYCTLIASGSAGLVVALEACDIGFGDEVIIPTYTWIATAIAVLNVNAIPVFVDSEQATGCISPDRIAEVVTERTKAIIPVHLHSSVADMNPILEIARQHNLLVIEDCSQAHGALYNGKRAGSLGHIGVFSMNQEKVLCCGEGGAVITDDPILGDRLWRVTADGGRIATDKQVIGEYEFIDAEGLLGSNYCMSDFQAAVLLSELDLLEQRNNIRRENAAYLDRHLTDLGFIPLRSSKFTDKRTFYKYAVQIKPADFKNVSTDLVCKALTAELGFTCYQTECQPVHKNFLYCPASKKRHALGDDYLRRIAVADLYLPVAEHHYNTTIVFNHRILLAEREAMDYIIEAFRKVKKNSDQLGGD